MKPRTKNSLSKHSLSKHSPSADLGEAAAAKASGVQPKQRQRGASEAFMLIMMPALLAFAGLAYDAGMAFNARREATNVAAAAARAGANQVSPDALYTINAPLLNPGDARRAARDHVRANGMEVVRTDVEIGVQMHVVVRTDHQTTFLGIIGIDEFVVEGEARAMAQNRARS